MSWLIPVLLIAAAVATWFFCLWLPRCNHFTIVEYWVYMPEAMLPKIEQLMTRMIRENPHNQGHHMCITKREGMLFTDIRLHVGLAKVEKNPSLFRPDLFDICVEPGLEELKRIGHCTALAKAQYVAQKRLTDRRHLCFMPHLADALSDLTNGPVIFDAVTDRLWTRESFHCSIGECNSLEDFDTNCRLVWIIDDVGGHFESRGLRKVGLPELKSLPLPEDERENGRAVLWDAMRQLWNGGDLPKEIVVNRFDARFRLVFKRTKLAEASVRMYRETQGAALPQVPRQ